MANLADYALVDPRQRLDVVDAGALIELVHRRVGQAEINHRAQLDQEAAIRSAAAGRQIGCEAGLLTNGLNDHIEQLARRGQERLAGYPRLHSSARSLASPE